MSQTAHRVESAMKSVSNLGVDSAPSQAQSGVDAALLRQRSVLFSVLNDEDATAIIRLGSLVHYAEKQSVFQVGDAGDHLLILLSGHVKVSLTSFDGKEVILSILEPGDVMGEMALFDGEPRSASLTTLDACSFLALWRRDFLPFLENNPQVALKLLAGLSRRLRSTNDLVGNLSFLNLSARLARVLLNLAKHYGTQTAAGVAISLKLSQEELGNLVGVSRESVNRQIRIWVEADVLEYTQGTLIIKKLDALVRDSHSTER